MAGLKELAAIGAINLPDELREKLYKKKWVVFAKRPFIGPKQVIEYLGRYTHKSAISNYRIINVDNGNVTFSYKDYRHGAKKKVMTLSAIEFIRRFALHILPDRFPRIKHFGILSSRGRVAHIPNLQLAMGMQIPCKDKEHIRAIALQRLKVNDLCPCCSKGKMKNIFHWRARDGPPPNADFIQGLVAALM